MEKRIAALESVIKPAAKKGWFSGFIAWLGPELPKFAFAVVLLMFGYWIKDSVDIAIRQQQLQLSFVTGMKAGLDEMAKDRVPLTAVEQAAAVLAAFGRPAIPPLINELRQGGNRTIGAEAGLTALALTESEEVCRLLERALARSSQLFEAEGYGAAVRALAASDCRDSLKILVLHAQRAEQMLAALEASVGAGGSPPPVSWLRERPGVPQAKEIVRALHASVAALKAGTS